ncbi:MAG: hypothetical protein ACT4O3_08345, partial [Elusimicrobiota bacterium]
CGNKINQVFKDADINGIWELSDREKAARFLGLTKIPETDYCIDLDLGAGEAKIQFAYDNDHKTSRAHIKDRESGAYRMSYDNKSRDFSFSFDKSEPIIYWHFFDSSPYNANEQGNYDGAKSRFKTLADCIKGIQDMDSTLPAEGGEGAFDPAEKTVQ